MTSVEKSFDQNWDTRKEARYNHWTEGAPSNQIQLAFRRHWITFQRYLSNLPSKNVLEIGCGRGTISSYFAADGYDATLLDSSETVIRLARDVFGANLHVANFTVGDAFHLPFRSDHYGVCVSIGLLEHFDGIEALLGEQIRVLAPGGVLLAYIVPERADNVQQNFRWLTQPLKMVGSLFEAKATGAAKTPVYRNGLSAANYIAALKKFRATHVESFGMYPLPMLSHSPEFPFSLLPQPLEWTLARAFSVTLAVRRGLFGKDPWTCREEFGQAFLVTARKPS